jgi:hypothetical protein
MSQEAYLTVKPPQWAKERMEFGPLGLKPTSSWRSQHVNMTQEVMFDNQYKQLLAPPSNIWGDVFYGYTQREGYTSAPVFPPKRK